MNDKIKLFETVLGIHEKGAASLTSSERSLIEQETRALLNAASRKQAMKAPEGFDSFLAKLKTAENADEAYAMILKYLQEDEGGPDKSEMPKIPMGEEKHEEKEEKIIEDLEKGADDLEGLEKAEEPKEKGPDKPKGPDMKDKDKPKDKEDKPEGKDKDKPKDKEEKPDLDKDRKELMAKIKKAEEDKKEEDKKEKSKKDEMKEKSEEKKESSHLIPKLPATAAKVKVRVTGNKNLLVYFEDKPLFHAIPSAKVKRDGNALRRLANKVYGWVVYEGVNYALQKCGAKLLAGVDSDIEVTFDKDISPATEGITESGDDVVKDQLETPDGDVRDQADFDSQETHSKVEALRRKRTRAGVDDGGEVVTQEKPDSTPSTVTQADQDVIEESKDSPDNDVRDEADVDFKNVEANYRQLYASRARKAAKDANAAFVKRFIKTLKIASQRMALNYDAHPYKAASLDALIDAGLDSDVAQELTEVIASEGHNEFISQLLESTASLMKKSDDYLRDLEDDLKNLKSKPVKVSRIEPKRSQKSEKLRKSAEAGNFALTNVGTHVTRSSNPKQVGGIRAAVGGTHISRLASVISGQ